MLITRQIRYNVTQETVHSKDIGEYLTYGLQAQAYDDGKWREIDIYRDITTNPETAREIARLFNNNRLSPIHFRDAILDILR